MAIVRLRVKWQNSATMEASFRFRVDSVWLQRHTEGDVDSGAAVARLNATARDLQTWAAAGDGTLPFLEMFGNRIQLITSQFRDHPDRGQVTVSGRGPLVRLPAGGDADFECTLQTGAVTIWTRDGFSKQSNYFAWSDTIPFGSNSQLEFTRWLRRIWIESTAQVAGLKFGRNTIYVEVKSAADRKSLLLLREGQFERIWQLSDCDPNNQLVTPREAIQQLRRDIDAALQAGRWRDPASPAQTMIATAERRSISAQVRPEVYYQAGKVQGAVPVELLRPDFDIHFTDGDRSARWSPKFAKRSGAQFDLHDADYIEAILSEQPLPIDIAPVVSLTWHTTGLTPPTLSSAQTPPATCVGATGDEVQGGFVWQYANCDAAPATYPKLPALVRYRATRGERRAAASRESATLDGKIPISRRVLPDNWELTVEADEVAGRPRFAKTIQLVIVGGSSPRLELQLSSATVRAESPRLLCLVSRLADPSAVPNLRLLEETKTRRDPLAPRALIFSTESQARQTTTFRVGDLASGADLLNVPIFTPTQTVTLAAIAIMPLGQTTGINNANTSTWRLTQGGQQISQVVFSSPLTANVPTILTRLANSLLAPGVPILLSVTNGATANLPTMNVSIEYYAVDELTVLVDPSSTDPKLFVQSLAPDAVQLFWPHSPAALVDPIPAAAHNLEQRRDPITLRTIVERDASHGMTAWMAERFRLRIPEDGRLLARSGASGERMAMLDQTVGLRPVNAKLHSALSLAPWLACRDQLGGLSQLQLHHRNLVLEPGEFAAASQDRTMNGQAMAFANSVRDFIEAVRDPLTLAVDQLPVSPAAPAEIVNWLPGASLNAVPKANVLRPGANANVRDRFPRVALTEGISSSPQSLQVLYRDGSTPSPTEPTDWLTYRVRRNGWDNSATPARPRIELAPASDGSRDRWRLSRNSSVPALFDHAKIEAAHVVALPGTTSAEPANWLAVGDARGRVVIVDVAKISRRTFLQAGTQASPVAIKAVLVARLGNERGVIAIDESGFVRVWKSAGDLLSFALVNNSMPSLGPTRLAASCQVGALVAIVTADPQATAPTARLWIWDPSLGTNSTNPVSLTIPGVTAGDVADVSISAEGSNLVLAVAHTTNPAVVLRAQDNGTGWSFTSLAFPMPVVARLISVASLDGKAIILTVVDEKDCRTWRENTSHQVDEINHVTAAAKVIALAVGSFVSTAWMRPPLPNQGDVIAYLALENDRLEGWIVPQLGSASAPRTVDRVLTGHHGAINKLVASSTVLPAIGGRAPVAPRPHLIGIGDEGACRLWDVDAELLQASIHVCEDVYDNLGTIRSVQAKNRFSSAYVEPVNRPGSPGVSRTAANSAYLPLGSSLDFSFGVLRNAVPLVTSDTDSEGITQIYFACDGLRLRREGTHWKPETLEEDIEPGPDRPKLPYPFHRGFVGRWGMYSFVDGETEDLNYFPRLAGLPIFPTRLVAIRFREANSVVDFGKIDELEFEAALLNPMDVAQGRTARRGVKYHLSDLAAGEDLAAHSILIPQRQIVVTAVHIMPSGSTLGVDSSNTSHWILTAGSSVLATKTFGIDPFPAAGTHESLGAISLPRVAAGQSIELAVTNGPTADLPAVDVALDYYDLEDAPARLYESELKGRTTADRQQTLFVAQGRLVVTAVRIIAHGENLGIDSSHSSVWTLKSGSTPLASATFNPGNVFPPSGESATFAIANALVLDGASVDLAIDNDAGVNLPPVAVTVEYMLLDEENSQTPNFVQQAIRNQSVVRVKLSRPTLGEGLEIADVSSAAGHFTWSLPTTVDAPVTRENNLEGRLARISGEVSYEKFKMNTAATTTLVGRVVLNLALNECKAELLNGISTLDSSSISGNALKLVGYGQRKGANGTRRFGFETPRLEAQVPAAGMLPLELIRTADHIEFAAAKTVHALAVDELAESRSLVSADNTSSLTWSDLRTGRPWSTGFLDAPASDLRAGLFAVPLVWVGVGNRLQAHDPETKLARVPGNPLGSADARTDWSGGESITGVASAHSRVFVANAQGQVHCWDDMGQLRFKSNVFAGPVMQLVACDSQEGSLVAAVDTSQLNLTFIDGMRGETVPQNTAGELFSGISSSSRLGFQQIALERVGNELFFAAVSSGVARWWRVDATARVLEPTPLGTTSSNVVSIAIGSEGSAAVLYFTSDDQKLRRLALGGGVRVIGDIPATNSVIDYSKDDNLQILVAAAPGAAIRVWESPLSAVTWVVRDLATIPEDPAERLHVALCKIGADWAIAVGPGERLADSIPREQRVLQVFKLSDASELYKHLITADEVVAAGILGPRWAVEPVRVPHASACRASANDVALFDLHSGQTRFTLGHAEQVVATAFAQNGGSDHLLTTTKFHIRSWDVVGRAEIYNFTETSNIRDLQVADKFAAVAADKIRLWRHEHAPDASSHHLIFGDDDWLPQRISIRHDEERIVVLSISQSSSDSTQRLEVWVADLLLQSATQTHVWTVPHEIIDVAIIDGVTVAVSLKRDHLPGVVEVLDLSQSSNKPVTRWQCTLSGGADSTTRLTTLSRELADPMATQIVFVDADKIGAWALSPRLNISCDGAIDCHLPVELQTSAINGIGQISADILPQGNISIHRTTSSRSYPRRLIPGSVFRGTFGLTGEPVVAGSEAGEIGICLWRNVQGKLAGSFLQESVSSRTVQLAAVNVSNAPISVAAHADLVEQAFVAFNPDAVPPERKTSVISGRIVAPSGMGDLEFHIGDQSWNPAMSDQAIFAHVVCRVGSQPLQGPVLIQLNGEDQLKVVSGVYRLQSTQPAVLSPSAAQHDIFTPTVGDQLLATNLVSALFGTDTKSLYVDFRLTASGLVARVIPESDIPFDLCLDPGITGVLPASRSNVVQLVHRHLLGARLRHQQPPHDGGLLTGTPGAVWNPTGTPLQWLAAPILQTGTTYRILSQQVLIAESRTLPSSAIQTENLILLSRDDTDTDDLGAIVGLENRTAETSEQFVLAASTIAERLSVLQAPGAVFQRVIRGASPAIYRVLRRSNAQPGSSAGGTAIAASSSSSVDIDFRMQPPPAARTITRQFDYRYQLDEPAVDLAIESSRRALRRFAMTDVHWSDHPARRAADADYAFLLSERVAFHRLPMPACPPSPESVFPTVAQNARSFRPKSLEIQFGPDKPGGMVHHAVQVVELPHEAVGMPREVATVIAEPTSAFAIRDPMQLKPPVGADIQILNSTNRESHAHRQAERITVSWKETLGTVPVDRNLHSTVVLEQLNVVSGDTTTFPTVESIELQIAEPVVQIILRVNEDLIDVDAFQPRFPVYDARQSAATFSFLNDQNKLLKETAAASDRRSLAPQLNSSVKRLSTRLFDGQLWALATSADDTPAIESSLWRFDTQDPTRKDFNGNGGTFFAGDLGLRHAQLRLLCNYDGTSPGVFLLRNPADAPAVDVALTATVYDELRCLELQSASHSIAGDGSDVYEQITIEAYVGLKDHELSVWYQRSDQPAISPPLTISLDPGAVDGAQLELVQVSDLSLNAPNIDHQQLVIAVGGGTGHYRDRIELYRVDFREATPHAEPRGKLQIKNMTAFAIASIDDDLGLFVGDARGRVLRLDPVTGRTLKQYLHSDPIEQISVGKAAGRCIMAVAVALDSSDLQQQRLSIWDVAAETPLRGTAPSDVNYGVVHGIRLAGELHFAVAQTSGLGQIQIFNPSLAPFRVPELFALTRADDLTGETDPVTIGYLDGSSVAHEVDVSFEPWLVLADRINPGVEYASLLRDVLQLEETSGLGTSIWVWAPGFTANLPWERSSSLRIVWRSTTQIEGRTLEATLFTPLGNKQVKPTPYSAVAPKLAAVVLIDDMVAGSLTELSQRTAFFGDAATTVPGEPALRTGDVEFAYEAFDAETFDVPVPELTDDAQISVILVKYLTDGEVIGTGQRI